MKIFITGGTGFLGSALTKRLLTEDHSVTILTRSARGRPEQPGLTYAEGDPTRSGTWQQEVSGHDVVINLAGTSIFKPWNDKNKKTIRSSRISTTRNLVDAIRPAGPDITLLNGSAVGYYGFRGDEELDENNSAGDDFLAEVCRNWEAEAKKAEQYNTRVVLCRFGVILGKDGGALTKMLPVFKWGLGSPLGSGDQWFSWVALEDLVSIFLFLIDNSGISGPVNCTAPHPVTNREMTKALAKAVHRPAIMPPVPAFVIKGILGDFGNVFVKGQKVVPAKLLAQGFAFKYPKIEETFAELV